MENHTYITPIFVLTNGSTSLSIQADDLVPYDKLCSEAFVSDYAGKSVHFKAMFIGEWTITQPYELGGIKTKGQVFINHRNASYKASDAGLGSIDMAFPPFVISIPKDKSDIVYELSRGDIIEVWGKAESANLIGKTGLHISIEKTTKVQQKSSEEKVSLEELKEKPVQGKSQADDLVPYAKLCSEAFVSDYAGKSVHFKAMFIGEWTITQPYELSGIKTKGQVFINHRNASYKASDAGLGSSDMAFPPFALSIPKDRSDIVYELSRGDTIEVWGKAESANLIGKTGLSILIEKINKQ